MRPQNSLTAGFAAEAFSCVLWVPIDVVKERLQVQSALPQGHIRYRSSFDALRTICLQEGFGPPPIQPVLSSSAPAAVALSRLAAIDYMALNLALQPHGGGGGGGGACLSRWDLSWLYGDAL
jgi:hypothetical protein